LREQLPFIIVVTLATALVIGLVELAPRLHASHPILTLQETGQPSSTGLSVLVDGDVPYPGLYEIDTDSTIGNVLDRAGCSDSLQSITITVSGSTTGSEAQRIDLNTADAWLLEALPGIGPAKAEAIVQYRSAHGPFAYVEQLVQVEGIGDSIVEEITPFVTVTGA
jgi:competence protein ComEA